MKEWRRDGLVLALLTGLFCLRFYYPRFIFQGDILLNLYLHTYVRLFQGGWDPYVWGYLGWYPVFGGMFPLNFLMHFLTKFVFGESPLATLVLLQFNAAISLFLLAWATYFFFRFLDRSRLAAIAGAVVVCSTGFHIQTGIRELDLFYLHSFLCVPLVFMALLKAVESGRMRWVWGAGILIGCSLLGGGNVPLFMCVPGFACVALLRQKPEISLSACSRSLRYALGAGIIGIVVAAAMVLPSCKYMYLTERSFTTADYTQGSASFLYTLATLFFRDWWPRFTQPTTVGQYHEFDAFIGLPAAFLAIVGLCRSQAKGRWGMMFLLFLGLVAMHLRYLPGIVVRPLATLLAAMSIRYPYRFFMVVLFSLSFFVACGVDALPQLVRSRKKMWVVVALAVATAAYCVAGYWFFVHSAIFEHQPALCACLASSVGFALLISLWAFKKSPTPLGNRWYPVLLIGVLYVFYFFSWTDSLIRIDYRIRGKKPAVLEHYPSQREWIKFFFTQPAAEFPPQDFQNPFRIFAAGLTRQNVWAPAHRASIAFEPMDDPATPRLLYRYYHLIQSLDSPLFDLYNVRFLKLSGYTGEKLRPTPVAGLYYNPAAFRRFFTVHQARFFSDEEALGNALAQASDQELATKVFLVGTDAGLPSAPSVPSDMSEASDACVILQMEPRKISLEVTMRRAGFLIGSELWFPAWKAYVDGRQTPIRAAYGVFWAVPLAQGSHQVIFRFHDQYTLIGKWISVISMLAAVVGFLLLSRRRRPR